VQHHVCIKSLALGVLGVQLEMQMMLVLGNAFWKEKGSWNSKMYFLICHKKKKKIS